MLKELRDFLLRGNIVDLAVAFVMGLASAAVVNSLVNDLTFTINGATFGYGAFITHVIQFIAIAAAVFFFVVKPVDALLQRYRSPAEEAMPDEERRHQELLAALQGRTT
jgi:large conductance mechanosensitive channel